MAIKATFYKLSAPNETDKCLILNTLGNIESLEDMKKRQYRTQQRQGGWWDPSYDFLKHPSCRVDVVIAGEFEEFEDFKQFEEILIKILPSEYTHTDDYIAKVLAHKQIYRKGFIKEILNKKHSKLLKKIADSEVMNDVILHEIVSDTDDEYPDDGEDPSSLEDFRCGTRLIIDNRCTKEAADHTSEAAPSDTAADGDDDPPSSKNTISCDTCGGSYTKKTKARHFKSQKHLDAASKNEA